MHMRYNDIVKIRKKHFKNLSNKMNSIYAVMTVSEKEKKKTNKNILEHALYGGHLIICVAEGECI